VCQGENVYGSVYGGVKIFHKSGADVRGAVKIVGVRAVSNVKVLVAYGEDRVAGKPLFSLSVRCVKNISEKVS